MAPSKSSLNGAASQQPKRPASAFMIFSKGFHLDYKTKNPNLKYDVKEVAKLAGEGWRRLDAAKKKKYLDEYARLKTKYDKDMANYDGPIIKKTRKGAKIIKDPNAPKRPMSAYILYANDFRNKVKSEQPSASMTEITSELARRWREADQKTKSKYDKLAVDARNKYQVAVEKYNAKKGVSPTKGGKGGKAAAGGGRGRKAQVVEEDDDEEDEDDEDEDDDEEDDD